MKTDGNKGLMVAFKDALVDCYKNKVIRLATIGGMFRFFGIFACDYYLPAFYLKMYPAFNAQYSALIAIIVVLGGMFSAISGGVLADKFSKKDPKAYAKIC